MEGTLKYRLLKYVWFILIIKRGNYVLYAAIFVLLLALVLPGACASSTDQPGYITGQAHGIKPVWFR